MGGFLQPPPVAQNTFSFAWIRWLQEFWNRLQKTGQTSLGAKGTLTLVGVTFTSNPGVKVTWTTGQAIYKNILYTIAAGSANTGAVIYWQLSNPTVLQTSVAFPMLGADDFVVGFNTSSGNPSTSGYFTPTLEIHLVNGSRTYLVESGVNGVNAAGNPTFALRRNGTDGPGSNADGSLFLFDGNGNPATFQIRGARHSMQPTAVTVANLPGSPTDGERCQVTDATNNTFGAAVTGGGANHVPVYWDGGAAAWKVG